MDLDRLRLTLIDFADSPCKGWGKTTDGTDVLVGQRSSVPIEQADRNTARLHSGTFTAEQFASFEAQCALVEQHPGTTAYFDSSIPEGLEYSHECQGCCKTFASCQSDANMCYDCVLRTLCPELPWQQVNHHWFYNDHEWTMQVFGDIGWHNELTFWWSNRNSGGNACHQGLTVTRNWNGSIKRMIFSTVAVNAKLRYRIIFHLETRTTKFLVSPNTSVNDNAYSQPSTEVDELDPRALDFIIAMMPAFMIQAHRPRNPANGCYA